MTIVPSGKPEMLNHHEKRQARRYKVRWNAKCKLGDGNIIKTHTIDVSSTGISVVLKNSVKNKVRGYIRIEAVIKGFTANIDAKIECKHTSLSNDSFLVGMQFTMLSDKGRQLIDAYTQNLSEEKVKAILTESITIV